MTSQNSAGGVPANNMGVASGYTHLIRPTSGD